MELKNQVVPVAGFALTLVACLLWATVKQSAPVGEIAAVILISLLVYTLLVTVYTWFTLKPHTLFESQRAEYEMLHQKIKATVDRLIQRERFIDQNMLRMIEREAQHIWVITTNLENELNDKELAKTVKQNLKSGKRYTYFLPHPQAIEFRSVKRNLERFKELPLYADHTSHVEIIRLPLDTQFLLEEVVIYNPEKPALKGEDESKGINGFTYYEAKDEKSAKLHMKIEGDLLKFLANRLESYLEESGLKYALEEILTEFSDVLPNEAKIDLANRFGSREMPEKELDALIDRVNTAEASRDHSGKIYEMLSPYKKKE